MRLNITLRRTEEVKLMKKILIILLALSLVLLVGCGTETGDTAADVSEQDATETDMSAKDMDEAESDQTDSEQDASDQTDSEQDASGDEDITEEMINLTKVTYNKQMKIGDTPVIVDWEKNDAVDALAALTSGKWYDIELSMYGGFEQVGSIGQTLPSDDEQTKTEAGDIVLYSSDQIVVFYGSNSWAYTRLGHIRDKSPEEMAELLGNGDVTISLYTEFTE